MEISLGKTIRLLIDMPENGLRRGTVGVVVAKFTEPMEAYEIEFCDETGATVAELAILPEYFEVVG